MTVRILLLCLLISPALGLAQTRDTLHFVLQADHLSSGQGGGGGSLQWHRAFPSQRHLFAGVAGFTLGESNWGYARLGFATPLPGKLTLTGSADLGSGSHHPGAFDYRIFRVVLRTPITPRIAAEVEAQNLDIDTSHGTLVKGALILPLGSGAEATLAYHTSAGGNLDARFASARLDLPRGNRKFLGGVSSGYTRLDVQGLVTLPEPADSLEIFAGMSLRRDVTLILSAVQFQEVNRYTALLSWQSAR